MNIETHQELRATSEPVAGVAALKQLRVLFVTTPARLGSWLVEGFADECQADVVLEEAFGAADGSARLNEERFDAVVVTHDDERLNAFEVVLAAENTGFDGPLIVVGSHAEAELDGMCYDAGADAYLCLAHATPSALMWRISQTIELGALRRENDRLKAARGEYGTTEIHDARSLLEDQRLVFQLPDSHEDSSLGDGSLNDIEFSDELQRHYQELLRAYIVMGSGSMAGDIDRLAAILVSSQFSLRDATRLHFTVLDEMVRGLGSRSARHVGDRAGLLSLEVLARLGDKYRRRYLDGVYPPRQLELPIW